MKSSDICAALRDRYKQPEWTLFFEVGNGTGANTKRHADALVMNMYPSRGLSILGFEIKVSRGDLNRELINPDKAEEVAKFCDEWWLAVPKGLVREIDNIPIPWGIMECENGKLKIVKKAKWLTAKPVTKEFMAGVLRSAGKLDNATIQEIKNKAWNEAIEHKQEQIKREIEDRTRKFTTIQNKLDEFEQLTGEKIGNYTDIPQLAERLKLARKAEELDVLIKGRFEGITGIRREMEMFLKRTDQYVGKV